MSKITYFNVGGIDNSNYSVTEDGGIRKKALILVEGEHTDSKKRKHTFDKQFIQQVAQNTNVLFEQGNPVPILLDHQKTVDSTVGELESPVRVEIITEQNLPNKKAKHLIGKLGIFADEVVIKADNAVEKVSKNIVRTISAGIDLATKCIREVSLTSTPAIVGMTLFHKHSANFQSSALSFDELENDDDRMEQLEAEYRELTEKLWIITQNIQFADDEMLNGTDPNELQMQAVEQFVDRFIELIGMGQENEQQEQQQDPRLQQNQSGYNPNFSPQQQQRPAMQGQGRFTQAPVAAFSMSDMEALNSAEFGYRQAIGGAIRAIRTRKTTGKTFGQIGQQFGKKMLNASRGKVAGIGRLGKRVGQTVTGNGKPNGSMMLSTRQQRRAVNAIDKAGGRQMTGSGKFTPSSNTTTKNLQHRNKNTYVPNSPL
ncbi:hypothetical protein [Scytonema sp. NUACC26]|uniref:hypothetical protein n=1 Tax=Scytonema sp. NUACC26 TaxID=3140176 RepID=UPI0034DC6EA7